MDMDAAALGQRQSTSSAVQPASDDTAAQLLLCG